MTDLRNISFSTYVLSLERKVFAQIIFIDRFHYT